VCVDPKKTAREEPTTRSPHRGGGLFHTPVALRDGEDASMLERDDRDRRRTHARTHKQITTAVMCVVRSDAD
jgi:hypothetical protein